MSEVKTEFDYELTTSLSYAAGGETREASFVRLKAPCAKHSKEAAALKQAFFRALPKVDVDVAQPGGGDVEVTGEDVIQLIASSVDVQLDEVLDVAKRLFTAGVEVASIDGEAKLTKHLIDALSQQDFETMVGEYLANFTAASVLAKTKKA